MTPESLFRCLPLSCTMMAKRCVERQEARKPMAINPNGAVAFPFCVRCAQGAQVKAELPDYQPPPWRATGVAAPKRKPVVVRRTPRPKPMCGACGKPTARQGRRFCSVECGNSAKRKYETSDGFTGRSCLHCGKALALIVNSLGYVDATKSRKRKFCSRVCGGKHNAKSQAEKIEPEALAQCGGLDAGSCLPLSPHTPLSP